MNDADFYVYFRRSYAHYYLGEYKKAMADLEKAFDLEPRDHRYFQMKGQYYDKMKQIGLAEYYLDMAIRFQPERVYYYSCRAAFRLEVGQYREALDDFNVLIGVNPYDYKSYYGRGLAQYNMKMKTEACLDWLYGREHNKNCNQFFFYKCTDLDLRGKNVKPVNYSFTIKPSFEWMKDTSLENYLEQNLQYPLGSFLNNSYGTVLVKFDVTSRKKIENIEIIHSPENGLTRAITRALKESEPYWVAPATQNGVPVDFTWYLPVNFRITYSEKDISDLVDSLNHYLENKDYGKVHKNSELILKINPFMKEVSNVKVLAEKNLGYQSSESYFHWLQSFDGMISEIHDEVWINADYVKIAFNEIWQVTSPERASFIRVSDWNSSFEFSEGSFIDYTTDGKIYATGAYDYKNRYGDFRFYYPNGNLSCEFTFYRNHVRDTSNFYYEDGSLHQMILFEDYNFRILAYHDSNGRNLIPAGTGKWEFSKPDYKNEKILKVSGDLRNYEREGTWQFSIDDEVILEENYVHGILTSGYYYEEGKKVKIQSTMIQSWILIPFSLGRAEQMEKDPDANIKLPFYL